MRVKSQRTETHSYTVWWRNLAHWRKFQFQKVAFSCHQCRYSMPGGWQSSQVSVSMMPVISKRLLADVILQKAFGGQCKICGRRTHTLLLWRRLFLCVSSHENLVPGEAQWSLCSEVDQQNFEAWRYRREVNHLAVYATEILVRI